MAGGDAFTRRVEERVSEPCRREYCRYCTVDPCTTRTQHGAVEVCTTLQHVQLATEHEAAECGWLNHWQTPRQKLLEQPSEVALKQASGQHASSIYRTTTVLCSATLLLVLS